MSDTQKIEMAREICALISEAVLFERERCALVADQLAEDAREGRSRVVKQSSKDRLTAEEIAAEFIAEGIRNPAIPTCTTPISRKAVAS